MNLVASRPIPLPVLRRGQWFDDFSRTGAIDPGYILTANGLIIKTLYGIQLSTIGAGFNSSTLTIPLSCTDFQFETVIRSVSVHNAQVAWRQKDSLNTWSLAVNYSINKVEVFKQNAGTFTSMGSFPLITPGFFKLGIRTRGPETSVYENGVRKLFIVDNLLQTQSSNVSLQSNLSGGQPLTEFQYVALIPY